MKIRRKRSIVAVGCITLILAGTAISLAPRPRYTTFRTRPVGPNNTAIEVEYPATWDARTVDPNQSADSTNRSVILTPGQRSPIQEWINAYVFHLNRKRKPVPCIYIELFTEEPNRDLASEVRNPGFSGPPDTIVGKVRTSKCSLGAVLIRDFTGSPPQQCDARFARIYVQTQRPLADEITVLGFADPRSNAETFRTVDDIVARMKLTSDPPARQP